MLGLLTNVNSLTVQNDLTQTMQKMNQNMQQLSTGRQINSAADNPAGLSISQRLQTQITGAQTGNQNIGEGIALSQTAEGGLQVIQNQLQKLRQLAIEAQNGTNSSTDVNALQQEANQILLGINHVSETTNYNGINLLSGYSNPPQTDHWSLNSQTVQREYYKKIAAYGNGEFLILDANNNAYISTNGKSWKTYSVPFNWNTPSALSWNGSQFLAVTESNNIYTSPDGIHWTKHVTPGTNNSGLVYTGSEYITYSTSLNQILTSSDGKNWSPISSLIHPDANSILYGNGTIVVTGYDGTQYSTDNGKTWNTSSGLTVSVPDATWNGKSFVAVDYTGNVWSSLNGKSWTKETTTGVTSSPFSLQYLNGTYYMSDSSGNVYASTDMAHWTKESSPTQTSGYPISSFAFGQDQLVAISINPTTNATIQSTPEAPSISIQTGSKTTDVMSVQLSDVTTAALNIKNLNLTQPLSLITLNKAINAITYEQQKYGQFQTTLSDQQQNNLAQAANEQQASSTITDANMIQQMSKMTKNQILMQTDLSMLNQANQQSKIYLMLYQTARLP